MYNISMVKMEYAPKVYISYWSNIYPIIELMLMSFAQKGINSIALHNKAILKKETTIQCILIINYCIVLSLELITMLGTS